MFNNLISPDDPARFLLKVRQGQWTAILAKIFRGREERVRRSWSRTTSPRKSWYDVPLVQRRWNRLISGDPAVDHVEYVCRSHLAGRRGLHAISLGCGTGARELGWASKGCFSRIDAIDVSSARIEHARQEAGAEGLDGILHYELGDIHTWDWRPNAYDVVLGEMSIHHFTPLEPLFLKIRSSLKPEGRLVVNEYVGPTRFQWTDDQVRLANKLLDQLPEERRVYWQTRSVKRRVHRPGVLSMILSDPSESVESSNIMPLLKKHFVLEDLKPYGGTLLQILLSDIGHHFLDEDAETQRLLGLCFDEEDRQMRAGRISSDFALAVCRRPAG